MRLRCVGGGGLALVLAVIPAATATAAVPLQGSSPGATNDEATPWQMANAAANMLRWTDVTPSMEVAPGWEFTTKVDDLLALELCTIAGKDVLAPEAPVMFQTELGETDWESDPIAFQENVWSYPSEKAAKRAWKKLRKSARLCTGSFAESTTGESANTQILSNGRTDTEVNGTPGVWVHSYFTQKLSESASSEGGYYVVFLNGDVIQSVEYDFVDTVNLSPDLRATVQRIAAVLADRWRQGARPR